jgi:hypothetical protein
MRKVFSSKQELFTFLDKLPWNTQKILIIDKEELAELLNDLILQREVIKGVLRGSGLDPLIYEKICNEIYSNVEQMKLEYKKDMKCQ